MSIEAMKIVRDNLKMGHTLSFAEVMIIQQAIDAAMLKAEPVSQPYKLPQWIPCSERIPEDKQNVIVYFGGDDTPFVDHDVYFNCGKFYWPEYQPGNYENEISKGRITHWMPLPAAPQEPTK